MSKERIILVDDDGFVLHDSNEKVERDRKIEERNNLVIEALKKQSVKSVSEAFGISRPTVYQIIKKHMLKYRKEHRK